MIYNHTQTRTNTCKHTHLRNTKEANNKQTTKPNIHICTYKHVHTYKHIRARVHGQLRVRWALSISSGYRGAPAPKAPGRHNHDDIQQQEALDTNFSSTRSVNVSTMD